MQKIVKILFGAILLVLTIQVSAFKYVRDNTSPNPILPLDSCLKLGADSIQQYIIDSDMNNSNHDLQRTLSLSECVDLSLRAFKAWSQKYTGKNSPVVVFNYSEPKWNKYTATAPPQFYESDDFINGKNRFNQLPYISYPQYECCDVRRLVDDGCILVNVNSNFIALFTLDKYVTLNSYIPSKEFPGTYEHIVIDYAYSAYIPRSNSEKLVKSFVDEWAQIIKDDPIKMVWLDGQLNFSLLNLNLEGNLWTIFRRKVKKELYTIEEMPTTVEGLFGDN